MRKTLITLITTILAAFCGILSAQNLTRAEYFFDTDPGVGKGDPIAVSAGTVVAIDSELPTAGLAPGFHTLFIRLQNADRVWSIAEGRVFYVQPPVETTPAPNLTAAEYFFDTDPGVGKGAPIVMQAGKTAEIVSEIPVAGLNAGFHSIFIRYRNENGVWSITERRTFYVQPQVENTSTPNLVQAEYFFGDDPGFGKGMAVKFDTVNMYEKDWELPLANLGAGKHRLAVRFKNDAGMWSIALADSFALAQCRDPIADFSVAKACTGQPITFVDKCTQVDAETVYEWDINNDGTVEYTAGAGNATHTFEQPGIYAVKLQVTNKGGCKYKIVQEVEVFSAPEKPEITEDNGTVSVKNPIQNGNYQWIDCDDNNSVIANAAGTSYTPAKTGNYATVIINENGCATMSECINVVISGLFNTRTHQPLTLYPNPNTGVFTVETDNDNTIEIFNAMGVKIFEKRLPAGSHTVRLEQAPAGLYLIRTNGGTNPVKSATFIVK